MFGLSNALKRFKNSPFENGFRLIVLKLDGKNPAVVMNDVDDLDVVAQHVVNGAL